MLRVLRVCWCRVGTYTRGRHNAMQAKLLAAQQTNHQPQAAGAEEHAQRHSRVHLRVEEAAVLVGGRRGRHRREDAGVGVLVKLCWGWVGGWVGLSMGEKVRSCTAAKTAKAAKEARRQGKAASQQRTHGHGALGQQPAGGGQEPWGR